MEEKSKCVPEILKTQFIQEFMCDKKVKALSSQFLSKSGTIIVQLITLSSDRSPMITFSPENFSREKFLAKMFV